jgi:hypothetical protein
VGLGHVHGDVGLAQDGVDLGGLAHGDADAGSDLDLVGLEGDRRPHRLEDAAGDPDRDLVAGGLLEQDGELVAGGVAELVSPSWNAWCSSQGQGQHGSRIWSRPCRRPTR